ncbi:MAG: hypothetical protein ABGZ31_15305, partial [Roseibacillus sp.]
PLRNGRGARASGASQWVSVERYLIKWIETKMENSKEPIEAGRGIAGRAREDVARKMRSKWCWER